MSARNITQTSRIFSHWNYWNFRFSEASQPDPIIIIIHVYIYILLYYNTLQYNTFISHIMPLLLLVSFYPHDVPINSHENKTSLHLAPCPMTSSAIIHPAAQTSSKWLKASPRRRSGLKYQAGPTPGPGRFNCWEPWQESWGYGRECNIWSVTWDRIWDLTSQLLICPTSKLGIYHLAIKHSNGKSSFIDEFSHLMPIYSWFPIAMFDYWRVYQVVYLGLDIYIFIIIWVYNGDTYDIYIYIKLYDIRVCLKLDATCPDTTSFFWEHDDYALESPIFRQTPMIAA